MAHPQHASEHTRIREAYLRMAKEANYRPAAPSDGFGNIQLTAEELHDPQKLEAEATEYADSLIRQENEYAFDIGTSNWETNRALAYAIEACRLLCGAADELAVKLLSMAIVEIQCEKQRLHPSERFGNRVTSS